MNSYPAGTLVRVATYTGTVLNPVGGFRDSSGALADPVIVTLAYRTSQTGLFTTVTYPAPPLARDGVGLYHADLDTTGGGGHVWTYVLDGIGGVQAIAGNSFIVRNPYA